MSPPRPARPPLSREAVLEAALALIDRRGLAACTMRAVAGELGVEAMSLYWHVKGKEALLDGVVELVLSDLGPAPEPATGWRQELGQLARRLRGALLRHRNAVPLLASRPAAVEAAMARLAARAIAALESAGLDRPTAIRAARTVVRCVIGFALADAGGPPAAAGGASPHAEAGPARDEPREAVGREEPEELFAFGMKALMDGLSLRVAP